jgi:hypothetical protein
VYHFFKGTHVYHFFGKSSVCHRRAAVRIDGYTNFLLVCVIAVAIANSRVVAQSAADTLLLTAATARNDLIRSFQAENKRGTSIFYTQTYGPRGRRVEFHGSIFGMIRDVQADGCKLKIESVLVDLYSGSIGRKLIGQAQNKYVVSVEFKLTPKMAANLKIVDARPVRQLTEDTNAVCSGDRRCSLAWLKLVADAPVIQETEITNDWADYDGDAKDFDGPVDQFLLPVSSADAGDGLIAKMRVFAQSCGQ